MQYECLSYEVINTVMSTGMKEALSKQGLCMLRFLLLFNKFSSLSIPVLYATVLFRPPLLCIYFAMLYFYWITPLNCKLSNNAMFLPQVLFSSSLQCSSKHESCDECYCYCTALSLAILYSSQASNELCLFIIFRAIIFAPWRDDAFNCVNCKFTSFEYKFCYFHILNIYLTFVGEINFRTLIPKPGVFYEKHMFTEC